MWIFLRIKDVRFFGFSDVENRTCEKSKSKIGNTELPVQKIRKIMAYVGSERTANSLSSWKAHKIRAVKRKWQSQCTVGKTCRIHEKPQIEVLSEFSRFQRTQNFFQNFSDCSGLVKFRKEARFEALSEGKKAGILGTKNFLKKFFN